MSETAHQKLMRWKTDPCAMVREEFHAEPDLWQREFLEAWASPEERLRLALQACAGPGKSTGLAWAGMHTLATGGNADDHPSGLAVSVTGQNLKANLWKELALWRSKSEFFRAAFDQTGNRFQSVDHPELRFIEGRAIPRSATPEQAGETLSGHHANIVFYLLDEAGSMPPVVKKRAEQGFSSCRWGRIGIAGNPTSHQGMLYDAVGNNASLYKVIRITGDPDDKRRSSRIDLAWAKQQVAQYGRDDPWVQAYILGLFPKSSLNTLLTPDEVRDAMERTLPDRAYTWAQKRLGIDCARFGLDRTVIFPRQGKRAFMPVEMRGADGPKIAARVAQAIEKWHSEMELVDATGGWGMSATDQLRVAGYSPIDIIYHAAAINPKYKNRRTEMWMEMAQWVKAGGWLPKVPGLIDELTVPTYSFDNGQYRLIDKDQIKPLLGGRSPDLGDGLANTFALPEAPSEREAMLTKSKASKGKVLADWNPIE